MHAKQIVSIKVFSALVALSITLSSMGAGSVRAHAAQPASQNQTDKLAATLDEAVKPGAFRSTDHFIIHFNATMDSQSSPNPLLSYPFTEGSSTWDADKKTLTFAPNDSLYPGDTYTFFIDPALRAMDGRIFDTSPQWTVQEIGRAHV